MTEIKADIDFIQLAKDVACIKQALLGNGQPGLCQRVETLESKERTSARVTGMVAGFSAIVGAAITSLINYFKM